MKLIKDTDFNVYGKPMPFLNFDGAMYDARYNDLGFESSEILNVIFIMSDLFITIEQTIIERNHDTNK